MGKWDMDKKACVSVNYLSHILKQFPYPSQANSLFVAAQENIFPICRKQLTNLSQPTSQYVAPPY